MNNVFVEDGFVVQYSRKLCKCNKLLGGSALRQNGNFEYRR